jgi:hypothetical protein
VGIAVLDFLGHPLADRVLNIRNMSFLAGVTIINIVIFGEAAYLRAHKREPFLIPTIIGGILTAAVTYLAGKYYSVDMIIFLYFLNTLIFGLTINTTIFYVKRSKWHQ